MLLLCGIALTLLVILAGRHRSTAPVSPVTRTVGSTTPRPALAQTKADFPDKVVLRPLPVSVQTASHEWTQGDGTSPAVMEKIAHGLEELVRLDEENSRIKQRQLVYRKQPVWIAVEQAKGNGESVKTLTLPGIDGQEVTVEVTSSDLALSGMSGTFTGRIPGKDESLVTLAFKQGREAFTVMSPQDGLFLQGHPREPGEIIVTSFDPEVYTPFTKCEPIKTAQTETHHE